MTVSFDDLIVLRDDGDRRFRADPTGSGFLFGGLTLALALTAAARTAPAALSPMSLSCKFVRFGRWAPLDITVDDVATSGSFATRDVRLTQDGVLIASASATFHRVEPGIDVDPGPSPALDAPLTYPLIIPTFATDVDPVEMRSPNGIGTATSTRVHPYWARPRRALGDDLSMHQAVLAFMSDYVVIRSPFTPGSSEGAGLQTFTLEHTLWFLRPFRADDWLLYDCQPIAVAGSRYLSRGSVHDADRRLVAAFVQEGFARPAATEMPAGAGDQGTDRVVK